jgi:hypothetical protein
LPAETWRLCRANPLLGDPASFVLGDVQRRRSHAAPQQALRFGRNRLGRVLDWDALLASLLAAPLAGRGGLDRRLFQLSALALGCDAFGGRFFPAALRMNAEIAP